MEATFERWSSPTDQDLEAYALLMTRSFGATVAQSARWIGRIGPERVRLAQGPHGLAGGLASYAMGQFFGGRAVPCLGVAGVAVQPEQRRQGLGSAMMRRFLVEAHAEGVALSALYAANHPLYRGVGYELAGSRAVGTIAPDRVRLGERAGSMKPLEAADEPVRRALYREVAAGRPGHLDREAGLWRRATCDRDDVPHRAWLAIAPDGRPEGYVTVEGRGGAILDQKLGVLDLVATTPWALRRILTFLGDFSSVVSELQLPVGPADPLLYALPEPRIEPLQHQRWLLRVVSVGPALEARGWPTGIAGRVDLQIDDPLLPGNAGSWVLDVEAGAARVRRGGSGSLRLGQRGLAALYSGFLAPREAVVCGLLEGDAAQFDLLARLLAGPAPWMLDAF